MKSVQILIDMSYQSYGTRIYKTIAPSLTATPRECWRLMGYTDADFDSAQNAGVSNSQLYKQAGNAIVKQVLMAIFKQMNIKSIKKTS